MLGKARDIGLEMERPDHHPVIAEAEDILTHLYVGAVDGLLRQAAVSRSDIEVVGMDGFMIAHRPERSWTWQIGDGGRLAKMTGLDVVDDFRSADVTMGGQGAPLLPVYHRAMTVEQALPALVVDFGQPPNITCIARDGSLDSIPVDPAGDIAEILSETIRQRPEQPHIVLATGGAWDQRAHISNMSAGLGVEVVPVETLGWNGEATGAEAMAYLAMRKLAMLPITFPGTTGAPYPMGGGMFHKGRLTEEDLLAKPKR